MDRGMERKMSGMAIDKQPGSVWRLCARAGQEAIHILHTLHILHTIHMIHISMIHISIIKQEFIHTSKKGPLIIKYYSMITKLS